MNINDRLGKEFYMAQNHKQANTEVVAIDRGKYVSMFLYDAVIAVSEGFNSKILIKRVSTDGKVSKLTTSRLLGVLRQYANTKDITASDLAKLPTNEYIDMSEWSK